MVSRIIGAIVLTLACPVKGRPPIGINGGSFVDELEFDVMLFTVDEEDEREDDEDATGEVQASLSKDSNREVIEVGVELFGSPLSTNQRLGDGVLVWEDAPPGVLNACNGERFARECRRAGVEYRPLGNMDVGNKGRGFLAL